LFPLTATLLAGGFFCTSPMEGAGGVDGLKHGLQTRRPVGRLGFLKADTSHLDLAFGTYQPFGYGLGLDQEGARDAGRVRFQDGLKHQCAAWWAQTSISRRRLSGTARASGSAS